MYRRCGLERVICSFVIDNTILSHNEMCDSDHYSIYYIIPM